MHYGISNLFELLTWSHIASRRETNPKPLRAVMMSTALWYEGVLISP